MASRKTYEKAKDRLCKNPYPLISKGNTGFDIDTNQVTFITESKSKKFSLKSKYEISKDILNEIINM